ncbi:hypothetical protein EJB05_44305, partial [Eragrostis curvula]
MPLLAFRETASQKRSPATVTLHVSEFRFPPTSRGWAALPPELISSIFHRLDLVDIMLCADKVCRSWRRVAREEPELWRRIHVRPTEELVGRGLADLGEMVADAVWYNLLTCWFDLEP